jgi:hypothetical protein
MRGTRDLENGIIRIANQRVPLVHQSVANTNNLEIIHRNFVLHTISRTQTATGAKSLTIFDHEKFLKFPNTQNINCT